MKVWLALFCIIYTAAKHARGSPLQTQEGMWLTLCDVHSLMPVEFFMFLSMGDFLPGCVFAVVVVKCFMIGVNV